jgi:hypothetical protein
MRRFESEEAYYAVPQAERRRGDFYWNTTKGDDKRRLVIRMPSQVWGSDKAAAPTRDWQDVYWTIAHANHCGATWSWDGDEVKPTLNPSLHAVGMWHGWVKNGKLVEA